MIVLAIDQSFTGTGIAVFAGETLRFYYQVSTKKTDGVKLRRQQIIENGIIKIYKKILLQCPISNLLIGIEDLAYGAVGKTKIDLAKLLGGILSRLMHEGFPPENLRPISPSKWKKFLTTQGNARKKEVIDAIDLKFKTGFQGKLKYNNIADAIGIGHYVQQHPDVFIKEVEEKEDA